MAIRSEPGLAASSAGEPFETFKACLEIGCIAPSTSAVQSILRHLLLVRRCSLYCGKPIASERGVSLPMIRGKTSINVRSLSDATTLAKYFSIGVIDVAAVAACRTRINVHAP